MIALLILLVFGLGWLFGAMLPCPTKTDRGERYTRPEVLFHGGCIGCSMQDKRGIEYCTGCRYFETDWTLPSLNDSHIAEEERMQRIRKEARNK